MNRPIPRLLLLHLQVLPGIGVTGGDGGKDVLPLLRRHAGTDRVDEGVPEHGHQVVVFQDALLDLLGQLPPLRAPWRMIWTPGQSLSPLCRRCRKMPRSIVWSRVRMPTSRSWAMTR